MAANDELQDLSYELKDWLLPKSAEDMRIVQRGMVLYRQGMVTDLHMDYVIRATVHDVMPVQVELDPQFFTMSKCSCPSDGWCRHLMATFFAAYAKVGSVSEWMEEWREPAREVNAFSTWGLQRAKDLLKASGVLKPDYSRWVQSMEVSFDSILKAKKHSNPYVTAELFEIYMKRMRAGAPAEEEWRLVYELIGNVVSFQKLARLSEEAAHSEENVKRAYLHLFHSLMDDAEILAARIGQRTLPFDFDEFIAKFVEDSTDLLTCVSGLEYERVYLYRMLWTDFFKKKAWREAEYERITARLKGLQESENPLPLMIAGMHQSFMLGEDERAFGLMDMVEDEAIVPYMLFWIDLFTGQKLWKRVGSVIEALLAKIRKYLEYLGSYHACTSFTRLAVKAISPYCVETGRVDLYERGLLQTLPFSFYDYEHLLFSRGQYDKWGELYSFIGIPFADLPKERVKIVEKAQPEVLLALLHQTVQREIDMKNRSSYRQAVRHLKKLRTLYKKAKRVDDWQFFLDTLLERTKRLRAFHEECKRSKLIDA